MNLVLDQKLPQTDLAAFWEEASPAELSDININEKRYVPSMRRIVKYFDFVRVQLVKVKPCDRLLMKRYFHSAVGTVGGPPVVVAPYAASRDPACVLH